MSTVLGGLHQSEDDRLVLRVGALVAALLVMASYLSAMYFVVDVVGDPSELLLIVGGTLVVSTVLSRYLPVRVAVGFAALLLAGGLGWYLTQLPNQTLAFIPHLEYIFALFAGHSILEIVNLKVWVLAVTPAPVFLTWYLALRRRYVASAAVGATTTGFFILTGDATFPVAMVGTVGSLALVGLGALERAEARIVDAEVVSIVLAAVVLVSLTVSLVPAGAAMSYSPSAGLVAGSSAGTTGNTVEASLLADSQSMNIRGSIELSPKVRWTVESNSGDYWRVGAYGLYTGDGWVRRGDASRNLGWLTTPDGPSRTVTQTFTPETRIATMPSAWRPTGIRGSAADAALATEDGSLKPARPLEAGESYTVTSERPIATTERLQDAGQNYPADIVERYTQLPDSTPDRVYEKTDRLTALAETPYETALTIENWLRTEREYSLEVDAPGNNVADEFLFERQRGYCVYFATTMAVMLRAEGIPARMVVGYTTGERVEDDTWVVRGYNSHAWVEAYFPDVGWVRFDPTPAGPRVEVESQSLSDARAEGQENVDTDDTVNADYETPTPSFPEQDPPWLNGSEENTNDILTLGPNQGPNETNGSTPTPTTAGSGGDGDSSGSEGSFEVVVPSREEVVLGAVALLGFVAGMRRSGASRRLYRGMWLRWQPRDDPEADVERAYERLEYLLEETDRQRLPGETIRQYLDAVDADERAREVATIRERAHYGGTVTEADADRAVELVDELVGER